jgi:hypothetical protein
MLDQVLVYDHLIAPPAQVDQVWAFFAGTVQSGRDLVASSTFQIVKNVEWVCQNQQVSALMSVQVLADWKMRTTPQQSPQAIKAWDPRTYRGLFPSCRIVRSAKVAYVREDGRVSYRRCTGRSNLVSWEKLPAHCAMRWDALVRGPTIDESSLELCLGPSFSWLQNFDDFHSA